MNNVAREHLFPAKLLSFLASVPTDIKKDEQKKLIAKWMTSNATIVLDAALATLTEEALAHKRWAPRTGSLTAPERKFNSFKQMNRKEARTATRLIGDVIPALTDDSMTIGEVYKAAEWTELVKRYLGVKKTKKIKKAVKVAGSA